MWHKPCRTFHPWCLCIKTRCLCYYFRLKDTKPSQMFCFFLCSGFVWKRFVGSANDLYCSEADSQRLMWSSPRKNSNVLLSAWHGLASCLAKGHNMCHDLSTECSGSITTRVIGIAQLLDMSRKHCWKRFAITYHAWSVDAHYSDVIMSAMASQITSVSIVCSTVCSDASLAFVRGIHRWPVDSPHK